MNTPATPSLPSSAHQRLIASHTPPWLIQAPAQTHTALRRAAGQPGDHAWLHAARQSLPGVMRQLQEAYARHQAHQQSIADPLQRLGTLEDFAAPRLAEAIEARFAMTLDVRSVALLHASHARIDQSFNGASADPVVAANQALRTATRPLLDAALQNFQAEDTRPGAMDKDAHLQAQVFENWQVLGPHIQGHALDIPAHEFAALARRIDLGGQYQKHIDSVFNAQAAGHFQAFERSALQVAAHLACLQQQIDLDTHDALLGLLQEQPEPRLHGQPLYCSTLQLWDAELSGILVIGTDRDLATSPQPVVVYIPDDPVAPLKCYASAQAFHNALRERLFSRGYPEFFCRFIPARQRSQIMARLHQHLYPKVKKGPWYGRRWLEQEADPHARLPLRDTRLSGPLFSTLYQRKLAVIKDNARFHGVPTAEQDQRSHEQRVAWWQNVALNTLNVAAFAVPLLGEVMLAVTAVQLGYEVYEGIESWAEGEREQAMGYLFDVVQNIALMAALGAAAHHAVPIPAIEAPALIDDLLPVTLADGKTRLWKPDLAPFAHDILLPADLKPDALGLYEYQGKQWLPLEGRLYCVKARADGSHVMEHPDGREGFSPPLRHNGAGAWLHVLDNPRQMQGLELLRRLGFDSERLADEDALPILRSSGISEAVLRRSLEHLQPPPGLLSDSVLRFQLERQLARAGQQAHFELIYQSLQTSYVAGVETLQQQLPGRLPRPVAEELLAHATPAEHQQVRKAQRLPARLFEEAHLYRQQIRLARAYEGLYLDSLHTPDTDALILHSLPALPGWSTQVRIEVRGGYFSGPLLDSIGPEDAPIRKVLIKDEDGYMARDDQDQHLNGRADLYASVLHALPDAERQALGVPHTGQRADLRRLLQAQPLPRHRLREVLQMPARKPAFRSPMRLADGRLGYPLSGRPGSIWTVSRDSLLNKLTLLELEHAWPEELLERLLATGMSFEAIDTRLDSLLAEREALTASLVAWSDQAAALPVSVPHPDPDPVPDTRQTSSRQRIADAIWRQWSVTSLPEAGVSAEPLMLYEAALEDFPEHLPAFFWERVSALQLDNLLPSPATTRQPIPLIDGARLEHWLARFVNARSLRLSQNRPSSETIWHGADVIQRVARALPGLTDLAVINQQLWLDQAQLDSLRALPHLRSLDLSGNRFNQYSALQLDWLHPERLILERTDLRHWPAWLDTRMPGPIRELSLAGNRLTELPVYILDNPYSPGNQSTIDLRGNPLSIGTILRARLDETLPGRSFRFLVDTPSALEVNLDILGSERAALNDAIAGWSEASTSQAPLGEQAIANRQRIGLALMEHWRAYARGENQTPLVLDNVDLADFPRHLPNFLYLRIRSLHLRDVTATHEQLDRLLSYFLNLSSLRISGPGMATLEPPMALAGLAQLTSLSLIDMGVQIDQRWAGFFSQLRQLECLELDGNRLGDIQDVSGLGRLPLRWLSLRNTGLQSWPAWLLDLLPAPLETLLLDNNQLNDIPEQLLANPRRQWGHSEISLHGNPLSHETLLQAHTSQHYGRSYSFEMDLPPQIQEITWYDSHDSDSTVSLSEVPDHQHSPSTSSTPEPSTVEPWLDNQLTRYTTWGQLVEEDDAHSLLDLIGYLQRSADYRNPDSRPQLVERVWRVLEAAAADSELRALLDGIAEEPLQMIQHEDTCPDGVMLEFNQMEVLVFTRQSLRDLPADDRGTALLALTRRLYRLHELDRIAREQAADRDEAEVRLAYRLRWAQVLDLPVVPHRMLYEAHARIQPGELETALARVQAGEQGDSFLSWAVTQPSWVSYLREQHAAQFDSLNRTYRDNLNRLTERYERQGLSLSSTDFETEARHLEQAYQDDQLTLLKVMTTEAAIGQ